MLGAKDIVEGMQGSVIYTAANNICEIISPRTQSK